MFINIVSILELLLTSRFKMSMRITEPSVPDTFQIFSDTV